MKIPLSAINKRLLPLAGLVTLLTLGACSSQRKIPMLEAYPASCRLVRAASYSTDPVRIAIDAGLAGPTLRSRYATLAVKDCEGSLHPGAATSWTTRNNDKLWLFDLQQDLQQADGTKMTATALSEFWQSKALSFAEIERIEPAGEYQLALHLAMPYRQFPEFLLSSSFLLPVYGDDTHRLELIDATGEDGRDVLEGSIQGLLTRNPDVIDYASSRPQWFKHSLPWDRSYVMVVRSGTGPGFPAFPGSVATSLANDVVPGDARAFKSPAWWENLNRCDVSFETKTAGGLEPVNDRQYIRYPAGDPVARGLAERMAALGSGNISINGADSLIALLPRMGDRSYQWSAKEALSNDVADPLSEGFDAVFVISLPRRVSDPCGEIQDLKKQMPALFDSRSGLPYPFVSLIDVRPTLILKKGSVNVDLDGFGGLLISSSTGDGR